MEVMREYYEEALKEFYESGGTEDELYWLMSSVLLREPSRHREFALRERLVDLIAEEAEGRVLDVGCGMGILSLRLALKDNVERVVGIDTDREMIQFCIRLRERFSPRSHFICGNLLDTEFERPFDTVIFLYSLRGSQIGKFLRKALTLLNPDERIIVGDFDFGSLRTRIEQFASREKLRTVKKRSLGTLLLGGRKGDAFLMVLSR